MKQHIPFPNEVEHPDELLNHWRRIRGDVLTLLAAIPDERLHTPPADGSWNAAQIAEHLFLTQNFFARALPAVLRGKFGVDITASQLDHKHAYEKVRKPQGVRNPEGVTPEGTWSREKIVESLNSSMNRLEKALSVVTAGQLRARGYEHPLEGVVDLLEYAWVLTLHEQAHLIAMESKWGASLE